MDESQVEAYLARIGAERPQRLDGDALRELQTRHLDTVPFENLSIHLGEEITLTEEALYDKVVVRRRGGFCYELNGLFAALLTALGHRVERLAARVHADGRLGPPYDHLTLRVETPEGNDGPWLADVGFGRFARHPLLFDGRSDQRDPEGVFRLAEAGDGDLDVLHEGVPQFRLERRPRDLADFEATCWWHRTSPKSHFTRSPVCSLPTEGGRVSLSGRTLITTTPQGREERVLTSDAELLAAYRTHFGVELSHPPTIPQPKP
ncbi:arylamine N-acetyltransferase family protein [Bailinhaonella thermotolerans]|uniref:Arylamine N-acetyltransferase n=1 Tax=Bailinhaonella thermotolerans TaxID=1070861 RepID=A0A3A4AU82_9ACTN|nr:arylamine N-acetyltransferase [Bailinhaonella thermotolerans]RJL32179.1 arylamine N-acetyltransferase [Bailinhaonella thermotolerans]